MLYQKQQVCEIRYKLLVCDKIYLFRKIITCHHLVRGFVIYSFTFLLSLSLHFDFHLSNNMQLIVVNFPRGLFSSICHL